MVRVSQHVDVELECSAAKHLLEWEPSLLLEGGSSNAFVTAAKARGSSFFVHVVLVLVIEEILVRDM